MAAAWMSAESTQEWLDGKKLTEPGAASEQSGRVVKLLAWFREVVVVAAVVVTNFFLG